MTKPVTIKAGAGCEDILWHLYDLGQEFHNRTDEFPARTAKNRRTPAPYLHRTFCRGKNRWSAWAYHNTQGVVVGATRNGCMDPN